MWACIWTYLCSGMDNGGGEWQSAYVPCLQGYLEASGLVACAKWPGYNCCLRCYGKRGEVVLDPRLLGSGRVGFAERNWTRFGSYRTPYSYSAQWNRVLNVWNNILYQKEKFAVLVVIWSASLAPFSRCVTIDTYIHTFIHTYTSFIPDDTDLHSTQVVNFEQEQAIKVFYIERLDW